jgi:formamidopyrimidine-DNA glycosylase
MIELPETYVLAEQINKTLVNKAIIKAVANEHPHGFAWYSGDPKEYQKKLKGKKVSTANPGTGYTCGGNTEIICEDMLLVISTPIKYHEPGAKLPKSHQLLLEFDDKSHMTCTVQMWGAMFCFPAKENGLPEKFIVKKSPDPLTDAFDKDYFDSLWNNTKPSLSAKAFLATEQRIPGLGNGVLQDILWNARIHPRRKLETINTKEQKKLYTCVKSTLLAMKKQGGRDTEKDLFGAKGGYKTILSSNTLKDPCPACGSSIIREAYLGGNIYFCPTCQPL